MRYEPPVVSPKELCIYISKRGTKSLLHFFKNNGRLGAKFGARVAHRPEYPAFCQAYVETLKQDTLLIASMDHAHQNFDHGLPDETYQETLSSFQRMLKKQADIF